MRVTGQSTDGEFGIPWGMEWVPWHEGRLGTGLHMPASAWEEHWEKSPRQMTLHGPSVFLNTPGGGWQGTPGMPGWVESPGPWQAATVLSLPIPSGCPRRGAAVPALGPR